MLQVKLSEVIQAVDDNLHELKPMIHTYSDLPEAGDADTLKAVSELPDAELCQLPELLTAFIEEVEDSEEQMRLHTLLEQKTSLHDFTNSLSSPDLEIWNALYQDMIFHIAIDWANINHLEIIDDRNEEHSIQ